MQVSNEAQAIFIGVCVSDKSIGRVEFASDFAWNPFEWRPQLANLSIESHILSLSYSDD